MADELTLNASAAYEDSTGVTDSLSPAEIFVTLATKRIAHLTVSVATSEQALNLGAISSLGYIFMVNRDDTNYVEIRSASGAGNDIIKLKAGEFALFRFGSDITAPYIIANTAAVVVEYMLFST